MAFVKITATSDAWSKIGDNVSSITFQNSGQYGVYINFTAADTEPTDDYGLVYGPFQGELKRDLVDMTTLSSPAYVWAKAISKQVNIIVEE